LKEPPCLLRVIANPLRTPDGLVGIGKNAVPPPPNLVSKGAEPTEKAITDGAFDYDAPRRGIAIRARPHRLHHETPLGHLHFEGSVIQDGRSAAFETRPDALIDAAIETHEPAAPGPQRYPIQVDSGGGPWCRHGPIQRLAAPDA
jgi:hypothetical protein